MNLHMIHNFVKNNYDSDQRSYSNISSDYHHPKDNQHDEKNDYQLGYYQAVSDYQRIHNFRNYPQSMMRIANKISNNQMFEISSFIDGYNDAKKNIKTKL